MVRYFTPSASPFTMGKITEGVTIKKKIGE